MVSPQAWCDFRNQSMPRQDIEWFIDANGNCRLRDKDSWSRANSTMAVERQEAERREWKKAQRHAE